MNDLQLGWVFHVELKSFHAKAATLAAIIKNNFEEFLV